MYIIPRPFSGPSRADAGHDIAGDPRQTQAIASRPRLIFRAITPVGLVMVWRSSRAASFIYDVRVEDARTGELIERQRLVRVSPRPLRHTLFAIDGTTFFQFTEESAPENGNDYPGRSSGTSKEHIP